MLVVGGGGGKGEGVRVHTFAATVGLRCMGALSEKQLHRKNN